MRYRRPKVEWVAPPNPTTVEEILVVYKASDGGATRALYDRLVAIGPIGEIAMNVFRTCKASERAKEYSRRFKGAAYDKKSWSMGNLCSILLAHPEIEIAWGWGYDAKATHFEHVLYVDLPTGQVSFHTDRKGDGFPYPGQWDGIKGVAAERICGWCADLLQGRLTTATKKEIKNVRTETRGQGATAPEHAGEPLREPTQTTLFD